MSSAVPKISFNGGTTWLEADSELWHAELMGHGDLMKTIVFSPYDPAHVVAIQAEEECPSLGPCQEAHGVIISQDGGLSWMRSSLQDGMAMDVTFAPDASLYLALYPGDLYRSFDQGRSWELISSDIASQIEVHDPDPDIPGPALYSLLVDPFDAGKIYAGFKRGGMMVSDDGGFSWRLSSSGMDPEATVTDLVADTQRPGLIYAASLESGVFVSSNGGDTWAAINDGLLTRAAVSLSLSNDGRVLYMASTGGGVFRLGTISP